MSARKEKNGFSIRKFAGETATYNRIRQGLRNLRRSATATQPIGGIKHRINVCLTAETFKIQIK